MTNVKLVVKQGSVLESELYMMFIDPLFRKMHLSMVGFADEVKSVEDITIHPTAETHREIYIALAMAKVNCTAFAIAKCVVIY